MLGNAYCGHEKFPINSVYVVWRKKTVEPMEEQDWGCILDALLMGGNKYIDLVDLCRLRGVNKLAKKKIDGE